MGDVKSEETVAWMPFTTEMVTVKLQTEDGQKQFGVSEGLSMVNVLKQWIKSWKSGLL